MRLFDLQQEAKQLFVETNNNQAVIEWILSVVDLYDIRIRYDKNIYHSSIDVKENEINIIDFHHKKVKKFVKKHFLEFVESSKLPKYDESHGEPLKWTAFRVDRKKGTQLYDIHNGQKVKDEVPYFEVTCMALAQYQLREFSESDYTYYSDYIFKIKLSDKEYNQTVNGTLSTELLMQKFKKCKMEQGSVYTT